MTALASRAARPEITRQRRSVEGSSSEARVAARPLIFAWLKAVEALVRTKKLKDLDYRLAVILTNCGPSANVGKCFAGQKRLADQAGRCERTIREALGRLESAGLLSTRRGGQGRTSRYTFSLNGRALIAKSEERHAAADLDRQHIAGLDRQQAAAKLSELQPIEQEASPPTPSHRAEVIDLVAERRTRGQAPITGQDFLANSYRVDSCLDGPALAEWNRLPPTDRQAIWRIIERDGFIDLEGVWACIFLKNRMWEPLISEPSKWAAQLDREVAQLRARSGSPDPFGPPEKVAGRVFVEEDTPQWVAWTRRYREHGSPNGVRVGPSSFGYDGKQGNFFASEWPPQ
jgi:DNA-binding MarR family transcriptional regulator